ncbi:MAG TPA: FAD binding domain-containing protein [Deltaproteobacteria bacterium]|nr:FAD binding domain-containing protein [Deltaproteobacteria bacterium]
MKPFAHFNATSMDEAVEILGRYGGRAAVIAGGTDLLGRMKDLVLPSYPEALVNIKTIPGLDAVGEDRGYLKIGALTRLSALASHPAVRAEYSALAEAADRTASPHLRNLGTIGGNLCQDIRCWYYRGPNNRFSCLRKGGGRCYALKGDNRFHSIFGASVEQGCVAVHPSDTAPVLIALDAEVETSKRTMKVMDLFTVRPLRTTVLDQDEILTGVRIPVPSPGTKGAFLKFAQRKSIDFPIVNCAAMLTFDEGVVKEARICLNAVYVTPRRAYAAERALAGRFLDEETAAEAAREAIADARPLQHNAYMVQVARTLVKRALLACGGQGE